jgi:class 3 adenylate cyclase/WD40 repeat protein/tRNA A-37 threonylcarbamoyl transferase component Bud32
LEVVGRGGEATVIKAIDIRHERLVALKVRPASPKEVSDRVLVEARALLTLPPHPGLAHARDDVFDDGRHTLVLDWVDGVDLARLLADAGSPGLPVSSVLRWVAQAAEALTVLHHHGVVHGDVKPANLILDRNGRIVLVDLGSSSVPTSVGPAGGTPGFRAPEVAGGAVPTRVSDVYSLAATAFALFTGGPPVGGPPSWSGVADDVAARLEVALRAGLAIDPARRPPTPGELVERLRAGWDDQTPTGVVTVMLSDVVGSTELWERSPERVPALLAEMQLVVDRRVEEHGGRRLGATVEGDATLSTFANAVDALRAAISVARDLSAGPSALRVRIGLATGELVAMDDDVLGPTVNRAARVRELARAGEVLLAASTAEVVRLALPPGVELVALGGHVLRGLDGIDEIAAVLADGVTSPPDPTRSPYPGLAPFRQADAELFFGREEVVERCAELLRANRFVAVIGASGSGKTSVALAGVAPRLREVFVVRPGEHPLGALVEAGVADHPDAVLTVDQLEELVTTCRDPAERAAFVDAIVDRPGGLIVTVRADFYGEFGTFADLARQLASSQVLLGPLGPADVIRAVREPALRCGLEIEDGLAEVIAAELGHAPGALPLLGHALREAWLRREGRAITVAGYRASGGVHSAIAATAERALAALDKDGQAVARRLLLQMVELRPEAEDARRWISHTEATDIEPQRAPHVVATLAAARLIVVDRNQVTVAHEALLHAWPRLGEWIAEERAELLALQELRGATERWTASGRSDTDLYRGPRLDSALGLAEHERLNTGEAAFVDAGRKLRQREHEDARRRNRRLRGLVAITSIAAAIALVVGAIAVVQRNTAQQARDQAQQSRDDARHEALVSRSLALRATNRSVAALLAVEAYRQRPDARARGALVGTFTAAPSFAGYQYVTGAGSLAGVLVPGSSTAVVAIDGHDLKLLDLDSGQLDDRFPPADANVAQFSVLRTSADGRFVAQLAAASTITDERLDPLGIPEPCGNYEAVARHNGHGCAALYVYEVASGRRTLGPLVPPFGPGDVAVNADGTLIAVAGGFNGDAAVYRAATGELVGTLAGPPRPADVLIWRDTAAVSFGPDGRLYVGSMAGPVRVVDPTTMTVVDTFDAPPMSTHDSVIITADGLLVGGGDRALVAIDTATGQSRWSVDISQGVDTEPCPWLAVASNVGQLYCGNYYGTIEQRGLSDGQRSGVKLDPQLGGVGDLAVAPDGRELIAFGAFAPVVSRWRLDGTSPIIRRVAAGYTAIVGYDPTGQRLLVAPTEAAGSDGEGVLSWDPERDRATDTIDAPILGALWTSPDQLASRFADGTLGGYHISSHTTTKADIPTDLSDAWRSADRSRVYVAYPRTQGRDLRSEIWVFDATTGKRLDPTIEVDGDPVSSLSTTRDGTRVVITASGADHQVTTVHDATTGQQIGAPLLDRVNASVSPTGTLIAASSSGDLTEFDLATLTPVGTFPGARGIITDLQFSDDGQTLLATSGDQTVSLYDVATRARLGDPIPAAIPDGRPGWLRPDGKAVAITDRQGVAIWDVDPDHLADAACRLAGRNLTESEWHTYVSDLEQPRATCPT